MKGKNYNKMKKWNAKLSHKIGTPLGIHDKNKNELSVGDYVYYKGDKCIILWNSNFKQFEAMLCRSLWYGDNPYDENSYGKSNELRADDGCRMEITKIFSEKTKDSPN